jgi:branched-chain amino acid transport system permease protein
VFVMKLLCFALFACAFNLLLGYTGLLSFGHAAFLGARPTSPAGWSSSAQGWTPEIGLLGGTLFAALLGLLVGLVAIRRQGIYFAMITLALAQMVYFVCLQAPFTGGEDGLQGVPRGKLFGLIDAGVDTVHVLRRAGGVRGVLPGHRAHRAFALRQVLKAIRENEPRAISLGYDVDRYKLLAFVLSAGLAGLAGSLKTLVMGFATLSDVHWSHVGRGGADDLLGGVGTFFGPVMAPSSSSVCRTCWPTRWARG